MRWWKQLIVGIFILVLAGCGETSSDMTFGPVKVDIKSSDVCSSPSLYYQYQNGRKVYLVCLDEVNITIDGKTISLKQYLKDGEKEDDDKVSFLTDYMNIKEKINDGGTTTYQKDDLTIIRCDTALDNRDVYFGNAYLVYHDNYCK